MIGRIAGFAATLAGQIVLMTLFYWVCLPVVLMLLLPFTWNLPALPNHLSFEGRGGSHWSDGRGHRCHDAVEPVCTLKEWIRSTPRSRSTLFPLAGGQVKHASDAWA